ncbi:MAG TPA: hypothetical protein VN361_01955 [Oxalicibacterium sp.]|nr:hypothetical protein [Oxalicibacterium sp.]
MSTGRRGSPQENIASEDELEESANHQKADQKNDADNPQDDFHLPSPLQTRQEAYGKVHRGATVELNSWCAIEFMSRGNRA